MADELKNDQQTDTKVATTKPEKKEGGSPIIKLAKGFRRGKAVAKYAGGAVIAAGAVALAVPFLGTIMMCSLAVGAVAFIATMIMAYNYVQKKTPIGDMLMPLFVKTAEMVKQEATKEKATSSEEPKHSNSSSQKRTDTRAESSDSSAGSASTEPSKREYKLWDIAGHVYIFSDEPTVQELIKARNGVNTAGLYAVPNDTRVQLVLDEKNEAVRVRILVGERKGDEGWVCRSCLVADERLAS